jgi:hypothetical protein
MRRLLPLFVMVGLAGVLVPVLAVMAQLPSPTSAPRSCSPATGTANKPSATSSTDAKVIDEMIAILKETKSEDTFVVTAMALCGMGPEAKRALPQLIRNAERLGLLDGLLGSKTSKGDRETSQHVSEVIMMLAAGQPIGYLSTTRSMPAENGSYGTTSVIGGSISVVPSAVSPSPTPPMPCPVMSGPVVPGTGLQSVCVPAQVVPTSTPSVPVPSAPARTPLPALQNVPPTGSQSPPPATPLPSPTR